jgi:very-short-patch-repair endonuclease
VHDLDRLLADRARPQHGLVTTSQARALGFSDKMIRVRRQASRWQALAPDVFIVNGAPVTWATKVMAGCLATGGVASHRTAAVLHDVRGFRPGPVELTVPYTISRRAPGAIVHRSKDLERCSPVLIDHTPTTSVSRLVVDLGAVVPFSRYEAAVDDLIGRRLISWDDALIVLEAHSRKGRNGCGPLRALVEQRFGEHLPESVLERVFLQLLRDRQLDEPVPQYEVHDHAGFIARVDFAYPDRRVAVELDSVRYHLDAPTFEKDHIKRARLTAAGWKVLAFTWHMVIDHPVQVTDAVRRVLLAAA